jgi:hypothetical protein
VSFEISRSIWVKDVKLPLQHEECYTLEPVRLFHEEAHRRWLFHQSLTEIRRKWIRYVTVPGHLLRVKGVRNPPNHSGRSKFLGEWNANLGAAFGLNLGIGKQVTKIVWKIPIGSFCPYSLSNAPIPNVPTNRVAAFQPLSKTFVAHNSHRMLPLFTEYFASTFPRFHPFQF